MHSEIAVSYAYAIVEYMKDEGLYTPDVLAMPEFADMPAIEASFKDDRSFTIARDKMTDMLGAIAELQKQRGNMFLGMDVAKYISASHLGVLGYVLLACPHLGAALGRLERYARLIDRSYFMEVSIEGGLVKIAWPLLLNEIYQPFYAEMGLAAVLEFARNITDFDMRLHTTSFCHAPMGDLSHYTNFFGGKVLFNQSEVAIRFDVNHLNLGLRQPDEKLLGILENQAKQALAQIPNHEQFLQQVHAVMLTMCRERLPTLEEVASRLNMSARTLQRKLAHHKVTFQELLEQTQQHLVEQYLKDERLQLVEIAQLLGYSDQSAFTRAFKRWTGFTPKVYRNKMLKEKT